MAEDIEQTFAESKDATKGYINTIGGICPGTTAQGLLQGVKGQNSREFVVK